ncbi:carboxypeptidase-like regulatory domain-containing protein, partial [Bacillus subtilis]
GFTLGGRITAAGDGSALEFVTVLLNENGLWAVTDSTGCFRITHVPRGQVTMTVRCLGYATHTQVLEMTADRRDMA